MMLLVSVFFEPVRMTRNVGHLRVFIHEINLEGAPKAFSVDDRARGYDVLGELSSMFFADLNCQIQNGDVLTKVEVFVEIVALDNVELVNLVHHIFLLPW